MKILNITFSPNPAAYNINKQSKPAFENNFDYHKTNNPQEILGRSLVNFTGSSEKFEFSEDDRKFLNSTASNLKMSPENKKILEDTTASYLKENNFESLYDISGFNNEEEQDVYVERVGSALNFSEWDSEIFKSDLIERLEYRADGETYTPIERKYIKDAQIVDAILDKNKIAETDKFEVFTILETEAANEQYDSLFDIFKENGEDSITMRYFEEVFGKETAYDLLIDFSNAAFDGGKSVQINEHKISDQFYNKQTDIIIARSIAEAYDMDEYLEEEILQEVKKRYDGEKTVAHIAYDLAEKYNLPSGAESLIEETILVSDKMRDMLKDMRNKKK